MAVKVWYVTNNVLDSCHQEMSETSPGSDATSSPNYGWTVGTTGSGNYASADAGTEVAAASFGATIQPDGSIVTTANAGDCWRTTNKYTGTFATGNWTFQMAVIAVSLGGSQDGNAGFRLFRSANADGSGATEITSGRLEGGAVTNLTTSAQQSSVHNSTSIGSFTLDDEYLFVQVGWEITGAGAMTTMDVIHRIGTTASLVTSTDFVADTKATPTTASLATSLFAASVIIGTIITPSTVALALSTFAPTVTVANPVTATPSTAALSLSAFAPTVTATDHKTATPTTAALATSTFAPTVLTPRLVTPGVVALATVTFAPTVTGGAGLTVVPGTAALTTSTFAPSVLTPQVVTVGVASLTLAAYAPDATVAAVFVPPPPPHHALGSYTTDLLEQHRRDWTRRR